MKVYVICRYASNFLNFDLPYMQKEWELVDRPSQDAVVYAYGAEMMDEALNMPALKRVVYVKTGFGYDPVHNVERRISMDHYFSQFDLVFLDAGAVHDTYRHLRNVVRTPCSIDTNQVPFKVRTQIKSLLHASDPQAPQKDWERAYNIMTRTGLPHEVFPNRWAKQKFQPYPVFQEAYMRHDGFVHIARDVGFPPFIDGMYTTCLLDAGASGAICFWHNTFGTQDDLLETVFDLPLDVDQAAEQIKQISQSLDITRHSKATSEEIREKFSPERAVRFRYTEMNKLLENPCYRQKIKSLLGPLRVDFGGGCSLSKALKIAELIVQHKLKVTVDIGVYRGRSFVPQIVACEEVGGTAYGVDPYSNLEAKQELPHLNTDHHTTTFDYESLYQDTVAYMGRSGLKNYVMLRQPSMQAAEYFKKKKIVPELVHIDGNHSFDKVKQDADTYGNMLMPGGFLVFNDISWPSIAPHYRRLKWLWKPVFEDSPMDYGVVQKPTSML